MPSISLSDFADSRIAVAIFKASSWEIRASYTVQSSLMPWAVRVSVVLSCSFMLSKTRVEYLFRSSSTTEASGKSPVKSDIMARERFVLQV